MLKIEWIRNKPIKLQIHIMRCGDDFDYIIMRQAHFTQLLHDLADRKIVYNLNNYVSKDSLIAPKED